METVLGEHAVPFGAHGGPFRAGGSARRLRLNGAPLRPDAAAWGQAPAVWKRRPMRKPAAAAPSPIATIFRPFLRQSRDRDHQSVVRGRALYRPLRSGEKIARSISQGVACATFKGPR